MPAPRWAICGEKTPPLRRHFALSTSLERVVEVFVVPLDGWPHHRTKHREQEASDIFDVCEEHAAIRLRIEVELACAGKNPVSTHVSVPAEAAFRYDLGQRRLDLRRTECPWT
jgi:hypothetical protein